MKRLSSLCLALALVAGATPPTIGGEDPHFVEQPGALCPDGKNLRKWDAPVVADLDQDGWPDLILNDHGYGLRVLWNNRGRFGKPYDLVIGDMHGVAVGDIDQDGLLEIIVSRGGGSGSNARNAKVYRASREREFSEDKRLSVPLLAMRGRTLKLLDGDGDGDLDLLNFAFPAGGKGAASENYVYRNEGAGRFVLAGTLPASLRDGQKSAITDFDGDGVLDLLMYGQGRVRAFLGRGDLTFRDVTDSTMPKAITDVTSIIELDYDNDGDFDLFLSRGRDFEAGEVYFDAATRTLGFFNKRGRLRLDDFLADDVLNFENYQAQWPNKKLFVGESAYEYEFEGETHSGRDIKLVNSDALGWPDSTEAKGSYIGYVGNGRWRFEINIWSPTTGVLIGVESYPESKHPTGPADVLLENRDGVFSDVYADCGLESADHATGADIADFNNDGYQDLLVVFRGDLVSKNRSVVYLNNRDSTFSPLAGHNVESPELGAIGLGAGTVDFDRDGRSDIVLGPERGQWRLFRNDSQSVVESRHLAVVVGNSPVANASPLGVILEVTAKDHRQIRRIGTNAAAYSGGHANSMLFGLATWDGPVGIKATWPNGEVIEMMASTDQPRLRIGRINGEAPAVKDRAP